jgi:hypothetical protein
MRASATRTLQEFSVFGFKSSQAGVEQFAFGDDDDVVARCDLVLTENLSYQSFRAVSLNCSAQLLRRGDSQAAHRTGDRQHENRAVPAMNLRATVVNLLEVRPAADFLVGTKHVAHAPPQTRSGVIRC